MVQCRACRQTCNERTGTPFNHLQVPTDSAVLVVPGRLHDKLSLRDVAEMFDAASAPCILKPDASHPAPRQRPTLQH